jgi:hypothetical protein
MDAFFGPKFSSSFKRLGDALDWFCGFTYTGAGIAQGYQQVVVLAGLLLTETLALIAYVQGDIVRRPEVVWTYICLSLVPLAHLFLMLRSRGEGTSHAFDRGTLMFVRWSLLIGCTLVLAIAAACYALLLPGQGGIRLHVVSAAAYEWENDFPDLNIKKGDRGLEVDFIIDPKKFSQLKYPDPLVISTTIGKTYLDNWRVADAFGFEGTVADQKKRTEPPAILIDDDPQKTDDHSQSILWHGLQPASSYLLRLRMASKAGSAEQERAVKLAKEGSTSFIEADALPANK